MSAFEDYFAFLGLPRRLNMDKALLEERFRDLSRQYHPDYFYNAPPKERLAALAPCLTRKKNDPLAQGWILLREAGVEGGAVQVGHM